MRFEALKMSRPALVTLILAVALLAVFVVHAALYHFLCDDAFISFRYARNLIDGHGLVFNQGERVEGYTNFLWVLELAALWKGLGIRPEVASVILSSVCTAGTVALIAALALSSGRGTRRYAVLVCALALWVTNRSVAVWTTSGLETRQFTFLLLLGIYAVSNYWRGSRWLVFASLALAMAEYTRPEALMLWGCIAGWYVLDALCAHRFRWRNLVCLTAPYAVLVAAHFAFRYVYYGELLPNTYYAKDIGSLPRLGLSYMGLAVLEYALYLVVPLAIAGTIWRLRNGRDTTHILSWMIIVPHALYLIRMGGDHFEFRPMDFYWPLLYLAAADGVLVVAAQIGARFERRADNHGERPHNLPRFATWAAVGGLMTIILLYGASISWAHRRATLHLDTRKETFDLRTPLSEDNAAWLLAFPGMEWITGGFNALLDTCVQHSSGVRREEHAAFWRYQVQRWQPYERVAGTDYLPEDAVQKQRAVGIMPFYLPDLTIIDLYGLTDRTIARNDDLRGNGRVAHSRKPPPGYLRERGVNIQIGPAARTAADAFRDAEYAVRLANDLWMPVSSRDRAWLERAFADGKLFRGTRLDVDEPSGNIVVVGNDFVRGYRFLGRFDDGALDGWEAHGDAALGAPARGRRTGQGRVRGRVGSGLLNTFAAGDGDAAKVRYVSPRFTVDDHDVLTFFVGGGNGEGVGVELHSPTGRIGRWAGRNREQLEPVAIPLDAYVGETLWIEVVDRAVGGWGHILADHFLLSRTIPDDEARVLQASQAPGKASSSKPHSL